MAPAPPPRLIRVGRVAGAFGVRGEVRISAFTEKPAALLEYRDLLREDGSVGLTLLSGRAEKDAIVGRAAEIASKEDADALRGLFLYAPRDRFPPPDDDEFYLADLIGLAAVSPSGEALGQVKSVRDFGAGDILEIQPASGASWQVGFTAGNVPEVRLAAGEIVINRPGEVSERDP